MNQNEIKTAAAIVLEEVEKAEEAAAWVAPKVVKTTFETMAYSEFIGRDFGRPIYQREQVWSPKWKAEAADTIFSGLPFPALIVCHVTVGEKELFLLIDGVQRTTVFEAIYNDLSDSPDDELKREYMESYPVNVMIVTVDDVATAAELFLRYNNGNKLTGVQKARAEFSENVNKVLKEYDAMLKKAEVKKADTTAAIIAAAVVGEDINYNFAYKTGSNQTITNKILKSISALPPAPPAVVNVIKAVGALDKEYKSDFEKFNMIAPLSIAAIRESKRTGEALTADFLQSFMENLNTNNKSQITAKFSKGKSTTSEKMSVHSALGDDHHSGSAKDTHIRAAAFQYLLKKASTTEAAAAEAEAAAAEAAEVASVLTEMLK